MSEPQAEGQDRDIRKYVEKNLSWETSSEALMLPQWGLGWFLEQFCFVLRTNCTEECKAKNQRGDGRGGEEFDGRVEGQHKEVGSSGVTSREPLHRLCERARSQKPR